MTIFLALLILGAFASLLIMGNYRFHKLNEKSHLYEDTDRTYWDNSALYDDPFLN